MAASVLGNGLVSTSIQRYGRCFFQLNFKPPQISTPTPEPKDRKTKGKSSKRAQWRDRTLRDTGGPVQRHGVRGDVDRRIVTSRIDELLENGASGHVQIRAASPIVRGDH